MTSNIVEKRRRKDIIINIAILREAKINIQAKEER